MAARPFSYPHNCRLLRRSEFDAVYRRGKRRAGRQFVIFFAPRSASAGPAVPSRFGTSVKKALGNAVTRNLIRRRIREIIRLHRREWATGWDVVVHPRAAVATSPFAELEAEFVELLRSAIGGSSHS